MTEGEIRHTINDLNRDPNIQHHSEAMMKPEQFPKERRTMRKLMCRLTLFPVVLIVVPLIYYIGWCLVGHEESADFIKEVLQDFWNASIGE